MANIFRRLHRAWWVFRHDPQPLTGTSEDFARFLKAKWDVRVEHVTEPAPAGEPMPPSPPDLAPLPNNGPPLFEGLGVRAFLCWVGHAPDLGATGLLVLRTVEVDPPQRILGEVLVAREAWPEFRGLIDDCHAKLGAIVMSRDVARAAGMDDL